MTPGKSVGRGGGTDGDRPKRTRYRPARICGSSNLADCADSPVRCRVFFYPAMSDHGFDLPWFPFWASDFTDSRTVRNMTPEEVGVYVLLLCDQWKEGKVSDDPTEWRGVTNHADRNTVEAVLERCFNAVDGGYVNERLEKVRQKQVDKRMQKVRAGKASAKARRKSKRGKDKERRSNGVATDVERTHQRSTNESESDTEEEKLPIRELWEIWVDEVWDGDSAHRLTDKRRKKLQMTWREHLSERDAPQEFFRMMIRAILADDWWGEKEDTHVPETVLRNPERREKWAVKAAENGKKPKRGRNPFDVNQMRRL